MPRLADRLSQNERRVAALLLEGCQNAEIAQRLAMNPRTVKKHFARMFHKFEIRGGIKRIKLAVLLYRDQPEAKR